jgi:hypothetical protein
MLRRVVGLCLAGGAAYTLSDALSDHLIYLQALQHVTERVETHERFLDVLGASRRNQMTLGPWYNSSVATSLDGMAASVTIPCKGPLRSSDVNIRVRFAFSFHFHLPCVSIWTREVEISHLSLVPFAVPSLYQLQLNQTTESSAFTTCFLISRKVLFSANAYLRGCRECLSISHSTFMNNYVYCFGVKAKTLLTIFAVHSSQQRLSLDFVVYAFWGPVAVGYDGCDNRHGSWRGVGVDVAAGGSSPTAERCRWVWPSASKNSQWGV